MALEVGQVIDGKYRIVSLIGEGGMGAVYAGENVKIKRKVAIKVLHAGVAADAQTVLRFEREAQAAGTIGNDHILEILDLGELPSGDRYMVMEFLDGEPLSSRIQRHGRMTPQQICPIARQMLEGLSAAHSAGIIHRDLKPDNIYVLREKAGTADYVKIIDFGISKFQPLGSDAKNMTRTGAIMGTPYYMSPEQARGSADADLRSDLYAVGVIIFEALTARVPFDAATINELLFKIVLADPQPLAELVPDIDPAFASIVHKAMAREPHQRFQTATAFIAALDAWTHTGSAVSVPPPVDAKASVIAALGGGPAKAQTTATVPTGNTWTQSSVGLSAGRLGRGPIFAILGGVGLLVLVTGGVVTWKLASASNSDAPAATANPLPTVELAVPSAPPPAPEPSASAPSEPEASSEPPVGTAPEPVATATRPPKPVAGGTKPPTTTGGGDKPPTAKPPATSKNTAPDFGY